jgi:hypothetical protein
VETSTHRDQHDTVALPREDPQRNDTVALPRSTAAAVPAAGQPGPSHAAAGQPGPSHPATGWQAVADWRTSMSHSAPTAWSQVPPFLPPPGPPTILVMRNNAAVVGATLGSVSLFLSLIPVIGIVAWLLAPIALVTSAAGLLVGMARRVGRVGAIWGLLTSSLALLVCVAWTALVLAL